MKEVNDSNFHELVTNSEKPVIVDFWAPWCGPCRMVGPILEELSTEQKNVEIFKCNVDENPNSAMQFGIRSIPTVLFFNNGKVTDTQIGAVPKSAYVSKLNKLYEDM
jgi:thioredoxin 1